MMKPLRSLPYLPLQGEVDRKAGRVGSHAFQQTPSFAERRDPHPRGLPRHPPPCRGRKALPRRAKRQTHIRRRPVARYWRVALRVEPSAAEQLAASWQLCSPLTMACSDAFWSAGSAA